jgi:maltose phosphorylase
MQEHPQQYKKIMEKTGFRYDTETMAWKDIVEHMYFPALEERGIFLQQDGFMDKEQRMASELDPAERPINRHWSWDRILRSVFLKQADVLQGIFCFEDEYSVDPYAVISTFMSRARCMSLRCHPASIPYLPTASGKLKSL